MFKEIICTQFDSTEMNVTNQRNFDDDLEVSSNLSFDNEVSSIMYSIICYALMHFEVSSNALFFSLQLLPNHNPLAHPNPPAHPNSFFNPNLINWNWDDVIVISSDDEDDEEEPISSSTVASQVFVPGRKRVYCLVDESETNEDYEEEPISSSTCEDDFWMQ